MSIKSIIFVSVFISIHLYAQRIEPEHLTYLGAFRLPGPSGGSDWNYSCMALTYFPAGDSEGANDGFPGSLFASGHDHHQMVAEISIPVPVISADKNPDDLNAAQTLQPFTDIKAGLHGYLEIPVMGLAWLPPQNGQTAGKLHFCWGQHIQYQEASHGWCDTDLSAPRSAGPWYLKNINNYTSNDILFEIPSAWAEQYVQGRTLASGRFREGVWSGLGPALHAAAPWQDGNPPAPGDTLRHITTLLLYGENDPFVPEIVTDEARKMDGYKLADQWTGGAWLSYGGASAVVFAGTKAIGKSWYGFSNGTVWPYEGPYPPVPEPPHHQRGFWADSIHAQMIFYDPADLAETAQGITDTWTPQPYAVYDFTDLLFHPGYDYWEGKSRSIGGCAFDRERGLLYVAERRADGDKSIIHVWKISGPVSVGEEILPVSAAMLSNYPNPFNAQTRFEIRLKEQGHARLAVYNMNGQFIELLLDRESPAGTTHLTWNAHARPAGIYVAVLETKTERLSRKISLVK